MSGDGEGRLSRWSRLKRSDREGRPAPDAPEASEPHEAPRKRGSAAPVANRRLVPSLPPLAGYDDDDPDGGPPTKRAYGLPPVEAAPDDTEEDENRELTPDEREAVKDLPPIESLGKDSDFTPFLAENVPGFLRRRALRVLWRSDPVLAVRDGLNDYDENFSLANLVGKVVAGAKAVKGKGKKAAAKGRKKKQQATPERAETAAVPADDDDHEVGDGDGDDGDDHRLAGAGDGDHQVAEAGDGADSPDDDRRH